MENRVWRLYRGGMLLDALHGRPGADGHFPEDWLASTVEALNPDRPGRPAHEGLSEVLLPDGGTAYLRDLIDAPFHLLAKFLDSAERLRLQVHPSRADAKRLFGSEHGKTEAWYILDTRVIDGEAPYVLMGFKEDVTPAKLRALFEAQDAAGMMSLMHRISVKPGEVWLVEGGMPHAIGPGCLLLEIQEPTDYSISLETRDGSGNAVPEEMVHYGLGFDRMFECFRYTKLRLEALLAACRLEPTHLGEGYEELIPYSRTPCFSLRRRSVNGEAQVSPAGRACVLAVTKGGGTVGGIPVRRGDCLFVPADEGGYMITGDGLEVLECLPPVLKQTHGRLWAAAPTGVRIE